MGQPYYGLGPHHHKFDDCGDIIIGGTVFDPLPEPNANGEYDLGDAIFSPDPECPQLGVWIPKPMIGWR
jgi:hypothetical protein